MTNKKTMKSMLACFIFMSIALLLLALPLAQADAPAANADDAAPEPASSAKPLTVAKVIKPGSIWQKLRDADEFAMRGEVKASQDIVLNAPVRGRIEEVLVEEDDIVEAGQVIVRIDDKRAKQAVLSAKVKANSQAEIRRAEVAVDLAANRLEQVEQARQQNAASDWEVRQANLELEQAKAVQQAAKEQAEIAKAELELRELELEMHQVKTKVAGRVDRVAVEPGVTVTDETPIARILVLNPLEATTFLPTELYDRMEKGQAYWLEDMRSGQVIRGKLKAFSREGDLVSQTFRAVFEVDNPGEKMQAGFSVKLVGPVADEANTGEEDDE